MKLFLFLVSMLSLLVTSSSFSSNRIVLTEKNHIALIGVVDEESIATAIVQLESLPEKKVYIYINSPGGSVTAGLKFIEHLETTEKDVTCIVDVAISMAHAITQSCKYRVAVSSNIMMQHVTSASVSGTLAQIRGIYNVYLQNESRLMEFSAKRVGVTTEVFRERVRNEWWTSGNDSYAQHMVDEMVSVKCEPSLFKKETKSTKLFAGIFLVPIITNGCPYVAIKVDVKATHESDLEDFKTAVLEYLQPKFVDMP